LLIETHSLKPYKSRVRGTYDILWKTIEEINRSKASLFEANRKADAETIGAAKTYDRARQFPLQIGLTEKSEPFQLKAVEYQNSKTAKFPAARKSFTARNRLEITVKKFDEAKIPRRSRRRFITSFRRNGRTPSNVLERRTASIRKTTKPLTSKSKAIV
jgi:hypothetical protein